MSSIGTRIREVRKQKNMTQQELSEGIITRSYLSQIEKGAVQPSYGVLEKMAKKMGCDVEDLFKEPENKSYLLSQLKNAISLLEGKINDGNFESAEKVFQTIKFDFYEELNTSDKGLLEWCKGKQLENKKQWRQSSECFRNSYNLNKQSHNIIGIINSLNSLAYSKIKQNKNREAYDMMRECYNLSIRHNVGGPLKTSILITLGHAHLQLKEYFSAISFFTDAYELNIQTNIHVKTGDVLLMLAICYKEIQDFTKSEEVNNLALAYFQAISDNENLATIYHNLGNLYLTMKRYAKAIDYFLLSSEKFEEISHHNGMMISKVGLATAFFQNNQLSDAYQVCYQITSGHADPQYQGLSYLLLGDIEFSKGNYSHSLEIYLMAEKIFKDHNAQWGVKRTNYKKALTYSRLGQDKEALDIYNNLDIPNEGEPLFL